MIPLNVRCGESAGVIEFDPDNREHVRALEYLLAVSWAGLKPRLKKKGYDPESLDNLFNLALNSVRRHGPEGKIQREIERLLRQVRKNPDVIPHLRAQLQEVI